MYQTTVLITFQLEGFHNFPKAKEIFPEVGFLSNIHRHMFHFKLERQVNHDDRDVEFIMFKRQVIDYLQSEYYDLGYKALLFGSMSCEMIARELLLKFDCCSVEVWEDGENGAKITI